ncbi:hypothetical protein [Rhodococcus sp. NPDC049939]|uniref:hypothetical protein n=1 Tax=Rhodococcus sp. NPDC049939 TaxID=3155511 RepID=UPI003407EA8D
MSTGGKDPNEEPDSGQEDRPSQGTPPPPDGNYPPPPPQMPPPGAYPPPPGSYPPPQGPPPGGNYPPQGNYPPPPPQMPPPGGYPPPPPLPNYGYSEQISGGFSVGSAIGYGWNKFKDNALVWVGIMLIVVLIEIALSIIFGGLGATADTSGASSVWRILSTIVTAIIGYLINAALVRGSLRELDGNKPSFATFFEFTNVGTIIIASLIISVATTIGLFLFIIPALIVIFFTWWTLQFVVDQNQDAISAIKSSITVIAKNIGPVLLLALALVGINIIGLLLFVVGLLVSIPISIIASTYAYRVLTGRYVSA